MSNIIPRNYNQIVHLARNALAGAREEGESVGLVHNPAPKIEADFHFLTGNPVTPAIPGAQAQLGAHLVILKDAYQERREAVKNGREFCQLAIALLKPALGKTWNTAWQAAGFTQSSLAVPREPIAMLTNLRAFLGTNPALENPLAQITATHAETLAAAIDQATVSIAAARDLRLRLKATRDAAQRRLRKRLSALRAELEQLLLPDDGRWYDFGFSRPADGRMPAPVPEVVATPAGESSILVQWSASALAKNYRVTWKVLDDSAAMAKEAGIFIDRQCIITEIPREAAIGIGVSARNAAGETRFTTVEIPVATNYNPPMADPSSFSSSGSMGTFLASTAAPVACCDLPTADNSTA